MPSMPDDMRAGVGAAVVVDMMVEMTSAVALIGTGAMSRPVWRYAICVPSCIACVLGPRAHGHEACC